MKAPKGMLTVAKSMLSDAKGMPWTTDELRKVKPGMPSATK